MTFYEDPPYIAYPLFFKFCPTIPLLPLLLLLTCLFGWMGNHAMFDVILFNDYMDLHMSSLDTLVPEEPSCVFYATRCQVYWGLTHYIVFYWYSNLISHTQKHKHKHHTQGAVDWHTHINIYLHHLLCGHSSYLYYIKWIILISKIYFPQCLFFSKTIHL